MKSIFLNKFIFLLALGLVFIFSSCINGNNDKGSTKFDESLIKTEYDSLSNDSTIISNNPTTDKQKVIKINQDNALSQNPIDTFSYNVLFGLKPETIIEINRKYQSPNIYNNMTEGELVELEDLIIKLLKLDHLRSDLHISLMSGCSDDESRTCDSLENTYLKYNRCAIELINNKNSYYYNFTMFQKIFSIRIENSDDKRIKTYSWLKEYGGREITGGPYYSYYQIGDSINNWINTYIPILPPLIDIDKTDNMYTFKISEIKLNNSKFYMLYSKFYSGYNIALCIEVFNLSNDSLYRIPSFPLKSRSNIFGRRSNYYLLLKLKLRQRGVIDVHNIADKFNVSYNDETKVLQHVKINWHNTNHDYYKGKDTTKYKFVNNEFIRIRD